MFKNHLSIIDNLLCRFTKMVKKLILEIGNTLSEEENEHFSISQLLETNNELHRTITKYKNKITEHYINKSWDKFKKISNEYEMIFTTPNTSSNISKYNPVSRSFFKMWELLYDFKDNFNFPHVHPIKACMLCEGPGGFAEALIKYRSNNLDEYHGMSLKSNNDRNIPDWKFMDRIKIHYGADNTGNLYNMINIFHLVKTLGKNSMDFITADGGFDFSSDFNNQEEMSLKLIYCEIMSTLLLQKEGGSFVLKIYDMFTENSLKVIHLLRKFYKSINLVKPLTSRPANSEKYVVCVGYTRSEYFNEYFLMLFKLIKDDTHSIAIPLEYDIRLLKNIVCFNTYYTLRQMYYIQRTIDYINIFKEASSKWLANLIMSKHKKKSIKWCQKYNIPCVD